MPPNKGKNLGVDAVIKNCLDFLKFSNIYVNNHSTHPEINNLKDLTIQQKNIINTLYNSLFSKLNINELYEMSLKVNYAHYSQSDHLIKRGDSDTSMMIMCTGNADVVIHVDGNPLTVNSLWPGDYFGEMSLFTGEPRSADIIATSETKVIVITKEAIAGILESNHSLVTEIANMISSRLKLNESNREQLANASNKDSGSKPNFLVGLIKNFFKL
jgi:CRP-like cAMP-binding protein